MGGWGCQWEDGDTTIPGMLASHQPWTPQERPHTGVSEAQGWGGVSGGQKEKLDLSSRVVSAQCSRSQPAQSWPSHLGGGLGKGAGDTAEEPSSLGPARG